MKGTDKVMKWAIIIACAIFSVSAIMGIAAKNDEDKTDDSSTSTASICVEEA